MDSKKVVHGFCFFRRELCQIAGIFCILVEFVDLILHEGILLNNLCRGFFCSGFLKRCRPGERLAKIRCILPELLKFITNHVIADDIEQVGLEKFVSKDIFENFLIS